MQFINVSLLALAVSSAVGLPLVGKMEKRRPCFLVYEIYLGYCLPALTNTTAPADATLPDAGASKMIRANLVSDGIDAV